MKTTRMQAAAETIAAEMAYTIGFTGIDIEDVYRRTCKPPHLEMLTARQIHRRITRPVALIREYLAARGLDLVLETKTQTRTVGGKRISTASAVYYADKL